MGLPLANPMVSPILVGRTAQVELLTRAVDESADGQGHTILIAGEAGIGKSRLLGEARKQAAQRGFLILEGHCFEPDRSLPYAPLIDLLRARFTGRALDDMASELGACGPEPAKLLLELMAVLPSPTPAQVLAPEEEQRRLVQGLIQYFTARAVEQPTVVIVEDLHWSDDTSLEVLLRLARQVASAPLLLLLAYRTDEPHPSLQHFLAELDRGRLATELAVAPLTAGEVGEMVRAIFALDRPVGAAFVHVLSALTEGNPFFVEEVLGALVAAGDIYYAADGWERKPTARLRIPRSVQDAVRRRAARVGEEARQVLALAAVAGRRFDFALLQALTGRGEDELLRLIKELIGAQLLVEDSAERFAFRHALTREAVYAELLTRERRALHRRVAEALARGAPDPSDAHLEDLAYHAYEGGDWATALDYARRAGERAQTLAAPRAAVEQLTRALAAAEHLGRPPSSELHRARAQAYDLLGDFEAACADDEAALRLAEAAGDRVEAWRALLDLGFVWTGRDHERAGDHLQRALDLARAMGDPATLAHSLNRMGNWYANQEQPEPARQHHEEALASFERLGDRQGMAATLDLLGMASALGGDLVAALSFLQRASALFRELEDRQGLAGALANVGSGGIYEHDTLVGAERLAETIRTGGEALALAREIGWRAGEAFALAMGGEAFAAAGEFGRGLELLGDGRAIAEEIEHREWLAQAHVGLGGLHADLLALPTARGHVAQALALGRAMGSPIWTSIATGRLASVLVAQGEAGEAEAALAALGAALPMRTLGQRLMWCARAELALARDDAASALPILDRLFATTANLTGEGDVPRLARLKAQALAALGQADEAEALLRAAQAVAAAEGARPALWRLHAALAALYRDQDRTAEAEREAAAARRLVEAMAATVPDASLREGFLRAATALLPVPATTSARRAAKEALGGLTSREREIATWVARGRTNRAIADALCVSERTVEAHVANILRKLGFTTRAQIAAWAGERGLNRSDT